MLNENRRHNSLGAVEAVGVDERLCSESEAKLGASYNCPVYNNDIVSKIRAADNHQ